MKSSFSERRVQAGNSRIGVFANLLLAGVTDFLGVWTVMGTERQGRADNSLQAHLRLEIPHDVPLDTTPIPDHRFRPCLCICGLRFSPSREEPKCDDTLGIRAERACSYLQSGRSELHDWHPPERWSRARKKRSEELAAGALMLRSEAHA